MVVKSHGCTDWLRARASRCLLAATAAGAVALAGCSAAPGPGPGGGGPPAKVALTFVLSDGPGTPVIRHWQLSCEPAGGTRPGAAAACAALVKLNKPFAPMPKGIACPMILRSNRRIVVTGTWFGTKVHRLLVDGGCDMTLFSRLDRIFR
jgi:hypothetical protein